VAAGHQAEDFCLAGQISRLFKLLYLGEALIDIKRSVVASFCQKVDACLYLRRRLPIA